MAYLKACLVRMLVRLRAARGCARPDTEKTSIASRPLRADTTAERRHRTGYRMQQGFRDPPPTPATQTDRQAGRGGRAERRAKNSGVSGTRIKPEPTATTTRTRCGCGHGGAAAQPAACGAPRPAESRRKLAMRLRLQPKRVMQFESSCNCRTANLQRRVYRICAKPVIH